MLDSSPKIMQGMCLPVCTYRKITFLWCIFFPYHDSYGVWAKAYGCFSRDGD